jgi:hypothetical protein
MIIRAAARFWERRENIDDWCVGAPKGWLPVGVDIHRGVVRWIRLPSPGPSDALSAPFFDPAVATLRANTPAAPEVETELNVLVRTAQALAPVDPAGIIFHISRCGSTLVSNLLKTADDTVCVSEAGVFGTLFKALARQSRTNAARQLLPPLTTLFSNYRKHNPQRVVLKCTTQDVSSLLPLRTVWPTVPCLILVRDPVEVIVSNLMRPPKWLEVGRRISAFGALPQSIQSLDHVSVCAWVAGRFCAAARAGLDDNCLVLDYADLTPLVVRQIARVFGLVFSTTGDASFEIVARMNAKRPGEVYADDVALKQRLAIQPIRESAERWANAFYRELAHCSSNYWGKANTQG